MKSPESASRCSHCCFETHPLNILETKGTHTAARKHLENRHQTGRGGIVLCLKLAGVFSFKTSDTYTNVEACVCLTHCATALLRRDKYVSSHGLDAVSGVGDWGECHGMSTGENLGFTNLEMVERNAFRKE